METDKKIGDLLESLKNESNASCLDRLIELSKNSKLYRSEIDRVLSEFHSGGYEGSKYGYQDLVFDYLNRVLEDSVIEEDEYNNAALLKKIFRRREGDFYKFRFDEIKQIILKQLFRIYADNRVDEFEAVHKVQLQGLFDLSYDQMNDFSVEEAKTAIEKGADISDLDIFLKSED